MKISVKKVISVFLIAVLLVAAYLISYKITYSIRTKADPSVQTTAVPQGESTTAKSGGESNAPESTAAENISTLQNNESAANENESTTLPVSQDDTLPVPTVINMPTDDTWSVILLNRYYKMNDTFEPMLDEAVAGSGVYLEERVAVKYKEMAAAALSDGVTLTLASGYVSLDRQTRNFEKQIELYTSQGYTAEKAAASAAFTVLPSGCSEHNYGLAVDIGWKSESFAESPAYKWLVSHAAEYGFIERYTSAKESVTHFAAAPYHWRYVGVSAAKQINDGGYCLEEYLGKTN